MVSPTTAPYFSVIIPTYNRGNLIAQTIDSVLNQSFPDFEIIIVDDGSTDNTRQIIEDRYKAEDKVKYINQANAERGAARNNGLKHASGVYITYLDSDDIFFDNHLSVAFESAKENNTPEIFHLNYLIRNAKGDTVQHKNIKLKYLNSLLISGNIMSCQAVFIEKSVALKNLFNEDRSISTFEDWELWLRMASKYPILYIDKITSALINHGDRSVVNVDAKILIDKVTKFMGYVTNNNDIVDYYKSDMNKFKASCYTYISLHIAITHTNRTMAVRYLIKGFMEYPSVLFKRRFLAILKHLIITN